MSQNPSQPSLIPVQLRERLDFIDILRGFALIGVLAANMSSFSGYNPDPNAWAEPLDKAILILIQFLVRAKFYSLFSFLFGWGMAIQMLRAKEKQRPFTPLFIRRMLILLIIGLIHGMFIWFGDILTLYALLGLLLLTFRNRSEKTLLVTAVLCLLLSIVLTLPIDAVETFRQWYADLTAFMRQGNVPQEVYATGTYWEITQRRIQDFWSANSGVIYYFGNVFAMFLLGLYVGKRQIFQNVAHYRPLIRRVMWLGLAIGLIFNAVFVWNTLNPTWVPNEFDRFVNVTSRTIGAPALRLFYVAGITLVTQQEVWRARLKPLGYVGRLALTNYLLQSVVATLVFYNYGLGLYGRTDPTFGLIVTVLLFLFQIRFSEWWLEKYQFGPMEWLWRTLTYGKRQPLHHRDSYEMVQKTAVRNLRLLQLVIIGIVVIVGVTGLAVWFREFQTNGSPSSLPLALSELAASAPTPTATAEPSQANDVTVIVTPMVEAVAYEPNSVVAGSDMWALADSFDVEQALAEIEILTGPPFLGRRAASPGGRAAGDYIAEQFANYRLQPGGDEGTYFQTFPVTYTELAETPQIFVTLPDGTIQDSYQIHEDFAPLIRSYVGEGSGRGEIVWLNSCSTAWVPETIPALRVFPDLVDDLFMGSGTTITEAINLEQTMPLATSVELTQDTLEDELCGNGRCQARNVIGVLPGRDPAYADEIVIVSAHYDHLGQTPDGTAWVGANDDASGVAVMLEIARSWAEEGYVPRRTVLFIGWDAEELGLLGSIHYVKNPQYPPENIVGLLQLDMVGAGGDILYIDGEDDLTAEIRAVAEALEVNTDRIPLGRSDHVPFLNVGVPATLLIWLDEEGHTPIHYHRPADTPEVIDLDKLDAVGEVVGTTLLNLAESEPAIEETLVRRATAVTKNDLSTFLATSHANETAVDQFWFNDAQTFSPTEVTITADNVQVNDDTATGQVTLKIEYPPASGDNEPQVVSGSLPAAFKHGRNGWQWAGPDLAQLAESGVQVSTPTDSDLDLTGTGQIINDKYQQIAMGLGLESDPTGIDVRLLPDSNSLRTATALSLAETQQVWINPGIVQLVNSSDITESHKLTNALVQLVLADAGVTETAAPWLWHGLPLVWRAQTEPIPIQSGYLPQLQTAFNEGQPLPETAAAWAATDFLQRQLGWQRLGQFIINLGEQCRAGYCQDGTGLDTALKESLGSDANSFATAWQTDRQNQLQVMQNDLDALLADRTEAIIALDETAFLANVDTAVPALPSAQENWLAALEGENRPLNFTQSAHPLALLDDGSVLAQVNVDYQLTNRGPSTTSFVTLFTPAAVGYQWAGKQLFDLPGDKISVRYPAGEVALAEAIQVQASAWLTPLAESLVLDSVLPIQIELYDESTDLQAAVALPFPTADWASAWTAAEQPIKMRLFADGVLNDYEADLATQLTRQLLYQAGIEQEWLLSGISTARSRNFDGGVTQMKVAESWPAMMAAAADNKLLDLATLPPNHELTRESAALAKVQAWDAVRYLVNEYGGIMVVGSQNSNRVGNQSEAAFLQNWADSLAQGHIAPEWLEPVQSFDAQEAMAHIEALTTSEMAGRLAGTSGAEAAAAYISEQFAAAGLQPAGANNSYNQTVPITFTDAVETPRIDLLDETGNMGQSLLYRVDFLPLRSVVDGEPITGELVWVQDYGNRDLNGAIVLRKDGGSIEDEIEQALHHGASALLFTSFKQDEEELLSKQP